MKKKIFITAIIWALTLMSTTVLANTTPIDTQIMNMYDEALSEQSVTFDDLDNVPWAITPITELSKRGIVAGVGNNKFDPQKNVSRAEFIKLITATCGIVNPGLSSNFSDVNSSHWAYSYISSALQAGLIDIYDSTHLEPGTPVTREEICYMSVKALEFSKCMPEETKSTKIIFNDENLMGHYAVNSIYRLAALEVLNGRDNGSFSPKDPATRAESAKIIYNILNIIEENY